MASLMTMQFLIDSLADHTGESVEMTSDFEDDLGMDSLERMEFGVKIESNFDIQIPSDVISGWDNLNEVATYLDSIGVTTPA